jgi:cell division protein ZapA
MAHVTVTVNGRAYKMACRDGEEQRVLDLAAEVDAQVQKIKGKMRLVPEDRLFLMAAIVLADQLWETREELQRTMRQMGEFRSYQVIDGGGYQPRDTQRGPESGMARIDSLQQRLGQTVAGG